MADAWCYLLVRELLPVTDVWFVVWIGAWIMMMVDGKYIIMSNFRLGFFVIWRKCDKFALAKIAMGRI